MPTLREVAQGGIFINVAYSVVKPYQLLMCAYLHGKFFTYQELECGPHSELHVTSRFLSLCASMCVSHM